MDLLKRNNLAHCDDTGDGTRRIIVYFSMQVVDDEHVPEEQLEENFIEAMRKLHETLGNKLDNIIADFNVTRRGYCSDNWEDST